MIQVANLSKSYGTVQAVKNISFEINEGEIFGLLGPNGAGKSTTLSMLSSMLKCDKGIISIDGIKLNGNARKFKTLIGVVPQEISLYEELSAYENLLFWGKLYGIVVADLKKKIDETLKLIGLYERRKDLVKTYSGGMKRRINIAAALLHNPKVLLLDEPTVGIDPQSRNLIFEIIESLNKQGMTIVYTTHYMEEVERLCDRIAIVDNGEIIAQGTKNQLQELVPNTEEVQIEFETFTNSQFENLKSAISTQMSKDSNTVHIHAGVKELPVIISTCNSLSVKIKDIQLRKVNLEMIFLHLTGKQLRD